MITSTLHSILVSQKLLLEIEKFTIEIKIAQKLQARR